MASEQVSHLGMSLRGRCLADVGNDDPAPLAGKSMLQHGGQHCHALHPDTKI